MKKFRLLTALSAATLLAHYAKAQVPPQMINYQGRVIVGGTNFNGSGSFKFALVGPGGTPSYWSNNGTSVNGSEPSAAVALSVAQGLYSVQLGDAALPNMGAVPSSVFNNPDVRLRVWFNDGVNGSQLLTPDQRITSVGYAMMAGTVPDGAITSTKLAPGVINATNLTANSVTSEQLANVIGLGDSNTLGRLDIYRTTAGTPAISLFGQGSQISTYGSDGQEQIRLWGASWGELLLRDNSAQNFTTAQLLAHESGLFIAPLALDGIIPLPLATPGGALKLSLGSTNRVYLKAGNSGGQLSLYQNDGGLGVFLDGDSAGAGLLNIRSTNGATRIQLDGLSSVSGGGGEISVHDGSGTETVEILGAEGTSQGGKISLKSDTGVLAVQLRAEEFGGTGEGGILELYNSSGTRTVEVDGDSVDGGYIDVKNSAGSTRAQMQVVSDGSAFMALKNAAGVTTISLDGQDFNGEGRIVTQVLQITGGSDLSEQFDIKAIHDEVTTGMIVSIDPEKPGQLVTSSKAYDKTVAGIISGAGGIKPGMMMGQVGTAADGKHAVALTGRVYCWMDADKGAIKPGDLITTSDTPGHGMKVKSHRKAQGAVIGKAMSSLDKGKGLVLVLVNLQ